MALARLLVFNLELVTGGDIRAAIASAGARCRQFNGSYRHIYTTDSSMVQVHAGACMEINGP